MRFDLSSRPRGALRVIPEIPDFSMCQIEGKNGIGKTLAARLLELLTGGHPFSALPHAWVSLTENLGELEVRVSGLRNNATLLLRVDSARWVGRSHAACVQDPGGLAELDGHEITWEEVRRLLRVRRIAGDEGLPETLGRTLREHALEAEAGQSHVAEVLQAWSAAMLPSALSRLAGPAELMELRDVLRGLRVEAARLNEDRESGLSAEARLSQALNAVSGLQSLVEQGDPAVRAYREAFLLHRQAADVVADLEAQAPYRAQVVQASEARRTLLASWERKLELRQRAVVRAEVDEQQALRALGLRNWPDRAERDALRAATTRELEEQRANSQTMDNAGTVRQLTQDLERPLAYIPAPLLAERVVGGRRALTGAELRSGLRARREELRNVPEPEELTDVRRQIARLERRLQVVASLPGLRDVTERKRRNLEEAMRAVLELLGESDGRSGFAEYRLALEEQRSELQRTALAAAQRLAAVLTATGTAPPDPDAPTENAEDEDAQEASRQEALIPPEEAEQKLAERQAALSDELVASMPPMEISRFGIDLSKFGAISGARGAIAAALSEAKDGRQELDRRLAALEGQMEAASTQLASRRTDLRFYLDEVRGRDEAWSSWRPGLEQICELYGTTLEALAGEFLPPDGLSAADHEALPGEDAMAGIFKFASETASSLLECGAQVRDGWSTAAVFLNRETLKLAPRLAVPSSGDVPRSPDVERLLTSWAERVLGDLLSTPELVSELFDGASEVRMDLDEQSVEWRTSTGQRMRRPLEAFSSGEQVFAYTRAKLEQLKGLKDDGGEVVIVLDEFGAFVARERFGRLLTFVEHDALGRIADQVIVMLPLRVRESELSSVSESGSDTSPLEQVNERGYVATDVGVRS